MSVLRTQHLMPFMPYPDVVPGCPQGRVVSQFTFRPGMR
jgi:hypothetical protein